MSETRIKIKDLEMNGETAIRIAECLKKNEPEIWKVLSGELKQAFRIPDVVKSFYCYDETIQIAEETGDEIIKCDKQCEKCKQ